MITIDDKTYTEDDLNEAQLVQVHRVKQLQGQLMQLDMQAQELNVLINAYVNTIKEIGSEEG
jgi:hypothetical protein